MSRTLLRTVHGSHLYGTAHDGSDQDFYEVVADNESLRRDYARQTIQGDIDTLVIDLSTWLHQVEIGVPQACEAMFSTKADIDTLPGLRASYRLTSQAWDRYLRTAIKFVGHEGDFKRVRHGFRIAMNLGDIREYGRFDPTLSPTNLAFINWSAARTLNDPNYNPIKTVHLLSGLER